MASGPESSFAGNCDKCDSVRRSAPIESSFPTRCTSPTSTRFPFASVSPINLRRIFCPRRPAANFMNDNRPIRSDQLQHDPPLHPELPATTTERVHSTPTFWTVSPRCLSNNRRYGLIKGRDCRVTPPSLLRPSLPWLGRRARTAPRYDGNENPGPPHRNQPGSMGTTPAAGSALSPLAAQRRPVENLCPSVPAAARRSSHRRAP
jgi:hypothetical protein